MAKSLTSGSPKIAAPPLGSQCSVGRFSPDRLLVWVRPGQTHLGDLGDSVKGIMACEGPLRWTPIVHESRSRDALRIFCARSRSGRVGVVGIQGSTGSCTHFNSRLSIAPGTPPSHEPSMMDPFPQREVPPHRTRPTSSAISPNGNLSRHSHEVLLKTHITHRIWW